MDEMATQSKACAKSNRRIQFRPSMTHRCGSSGMRVAKLSTIHLTVAMDMPRKPFEANTNTPRVMVKTSFEIVEQIWSARNLPICAKSNRRVQFRPSMTHRCGSSGMRVAKLSTIHLTVAMDMPRKPFQANTNTRRVMVKTSFEIVEQIWSARSLREICQSARNLIDASNFDLQ